MNSSMIHQLNFLTMHIKLLLKSYVCMHINQNIQVEKCGEHFIVWQNFFLSHLFNCFFALPYCYVQICFFRQFVRSVPKVDYLTLRHGFMMVITLHPLLISPTLSLFLFFTDMWLVYILFLFLQ